MNETVIIAILAIITFFLYQASSKQKKKSRDARKRMVDKAWKREKM